MCINECEKCYSDETCFENKCYDKKCIKECKEYEDCNSNGDCYMYEKCNMICTEKTQTYIYFIIISLVLIVVVFIIFCGFYKLPTYDNELIFVYNKVDTVEDLSFETLNDQRKYNVQMLIEF